MLWVVKLQISKDTRRPIVSICRTLAEGNMGRRCGGITKQSHIILWKLVGFDLANIWPERQTYKHHICGDPWLGSERTERIPVVRVDCKATGGGVNVEGEGNSILLSLGETSTAEACPQNPSEKPLVDVEIFRKSDNTIIKIFDKRDRGIV
jgi:hypothetical protein